MISDASDAPFQERGLYVGLARLADEPVSPAGLLKIVRRGVMEWGSFAYGRRYLASAQALPLNPGHLPLREAAFDLPERRIRDGGAVPLTILDALPDAWGRKVLEAQHGGPLSDIDALLLTNEDRVGAMVFAETLPIRPDPPPAPAWDLETLADAARRLDAGLEVPAAVLRLLRGGSLGGLRPKATFVHAGRRHIAKFAARGDDCDMAVLEAATLDLAQACGIRVPPHSVVPVARDHALLVERFDRSGPLERERRLPYLSCAAVLDVAYASNDGSYVEFAQALRRMSARPELDLPELFRRMVFNIVVGNSDDHVKNHGVLHHAGEGWRLAPAFDLVPQLDGYADEQALAILPGRRAALLSLVREAAPHFGVGEAAAADTVEGIAGTVHSLARSCVEACGGDAVLGSRMQVFVGQRAARIAP